MKLKQVDYKTFEINGIYHSLPKRVRQSILFKDVIAVRISSRKSDPEFGKDFEGGNVFILNYKGIVWQFGKKSITNIWEIDENTLGMYDGQADIWVDVNELKVTRTIWNPWGLDNPEKY
ncbi:MAG: hypothetical protein VXW38_07530 [Bacteroidota bacterium]|nr:hypothetical protein [Bacteroidota bacterium]